MKELPLLPKLSDLSEYFGGMSVNRLHKHITRTGEGTGYLTVDDWQIPIKKIGREWRARKSEVKKICEQPTVVAPVHQRKAGRKPTSKINL